jgi:hypothetical protein
VETSDVDAIIAATRRRCADLAPIELTVDLPHIGPESIQIATIRELGRPAWCIHIAQVQGRNLLGQPPPAEWLARLSVPLSRQ